MEQFTDFTSQVIINAIINGVILLFLLFISSGSYWKFKSSETKINSILQFSIASGIIISSIMMAIGVISEDFFLGFISSEVLSGIGVEITGAFSTGFAFILIQRQLEIFAEEENRPDNHDHDTFIIDPNASISKTNTASDDFREADKFNNKLHYRILRNRKSIRRNHLRNIKS